MSGPIFLTIAGVGLLSVGTCLGFLTAALFATGAEPAQFAKPEIAGTVRICPRCKTGAGPHKPYDKRWTTFISTCPEQRVVVAQVRTLPGRVLPSAFVHGVSESG